MWYSFVLMLLVLVIIVFEKSEYRPVLIFIILVFLALDKVNYEKIKDKVKKWVDKFITTNLKIIVDRLRVNSLVIVMWVAVIIAIGCIVLSRCILMSQGKPIL